MRFLIVSMIAMALGGCIAAQIDEQRAEQACLSYGAKPGTNLYVQCRMSVGQQYAQERSARTQGLLAAGGMMMATPSRPAVTTCRTTFFGGAATTIC